MLDDAGTSVWHCSAFFPGTCEEFVFSSRGSRLTDIFFPSGNSYRSILKRILNYGVLESELLFSQLASLEGKQVGAGARL